MQEPITYIAHKTRQTQAPHSVSLTGSQNPRLVLGKPQHSSTGSTKHRANTSPVQGLIDPRFTLGESFLLLSSISKETQGTQGPPLTIFYIPDFYLCKNTGLPKKPQVDLWCTFFQNLRSVLGIHSFKTQGLPLVHTSTKPKAFPWSAHMQQLRQPPSKVQVQLNKLPPHYLARPLIRYNPYLLFTTIRSTLAGQDDPIKDSGSNMSNMVNNIKA